MVWIAVSHSTYTTLTPGSVVEIKHAWQCALYLLLLGLLRRPQQCLSRLRLALAQVTATQVSAVKVLSSPLRTDHRKSRGQRLCAILKTLRIQRSLRWPYLWLHCWWLCRRLGSGTLAPHLDGALGVHPSERGSGSVRKSATNRPVKSSQVKSSQVKLHRLPSSTAGFRSTFDRLPYGCLLFMYRLDLT